MQRLTPAWRTAERSKNRPKSAHQVGEFLSPIRGTKGDTRLHCATVRRAEGEGDGWQGNERQRNRKEAGGQVSRSVGGWRRATECAPYRSSRLEIFHAGNVENGAANDLLDDDVGVRIDAHHDEIAGDHGGIVVRDCAAGTVRQVDAEWRERLVVHQLLDFVCGEHGGVVAVWTRFVYRPEEGEVWQGNERQGNRRREIEARSGRARGPLRADGWDG